jgi:hypothetical protein
VRERRSSRSTSSREAPFCGAKTLAAPEGPTSGFVDVGRDEEPDAARGRIELRDVHALEVEQRRSAGTDLPLARVEQLRPERLRHARAAVRRGAPADGHHDPTGRSARAARISSPVPRVVACVGSLRLAPTRAIPDARDISTTATGPSGPGSTPKGASDRIAERPPWPGS